MKIITVFTIIIFSISLSLSHAQTPVPKGFSKGSLVLSDNTVVSGYIKENIRNAGSVILINETTQAKKKYDGNELASAEIDGTRYICIQGDFFNILSEGDLYFLQKASDASGKVSYNGAEAILITGTEGRKGDYFIYHKNNKQLNLVTAKNFDAVVALVFRDDAAAINKATAARNDIPQLKQAVAMYNSRNK